MFEPTISAPVSTNDGNDPKWEKKRLKQACQAFEAVLTRQMVKSMRESVIRAEESNHAEEMYESMMNDALATEMTRSGGMGIADMLYRELLPLVESQTAKPGETAPAAEQSMPETEEGEDVKVAEAEPDLDD